MPLLEIDKAWGQCFSEAFFEPELTCSCLLRLVRLVLYGFFVISASVGLVIALAQLPAGLANAPGALPTKGTLEVQVATETYRNSYSAHLH